MDVTVPVLRDPVTSAALIDMLRSQVQSMGLDRIRRNDHCMAVRRLEAYLATLPAGTVNLDEALTDFVEVSLRGEIQKGSGKPAITLRNLFPESKTLFEAYLRLRGSVGTEATSLLVSEDGRPLLVSGSRNAVRRVSRELGIVTDAGKTPAPHRYRHSLGTLNVGELGMRLTPYYLMRRYRHNDIRTTMQVYVTSNPLLDEAQHVAIVNAANCNGANGNGANGNGHTMAAQPETRAMALDIRVPEMEAMAKVRSLGINWRSMREHAVGERVSIERVGRMYYSESCSSAGPVWRRPAMWSNRSAAKTEQTPTGTDRHIWRPCHPPSAGLGNPLFLEKSVSDRTTDRPPAENPRKTPFVEKFCRLAVNPCR